MEQNKKTDQIYALTVGRDIQVISLEYSLRICPAHVETVFTLLMYKLVKQNTDDEICSQKV